MKLSKGFGVIIICWDMVGYGGAHGAKSKTDTVFEFVLLDISGSRHSAVQDAPRSVGAALVLDGGGASGGASGAVVEAGRLDVVVFFAEQRWD